MFTQESENLAKVSNSIGCDIRLALLALDKVDQGIWQKEVRSVRTHVLNITFKLMEFSANPAGPKPEPATKD